MIHTAREMSREDFTFLPLFAEGYGTSFSKIGSTFCLQQGHCLKPCVLRAYSLRKSLRIWKKCQERSSLFYDFQEKKLTVSHNFLERTFFSHAGFRDRFILALGVANGLAIPGPVLSLLLSSCQKRFCSKMEHDRKREGNTIYFSRVWIEILKHDLIVTLKPEMYY